MPDTTHPEQRRVAARIYTPSGWIMGTFHVPAEQAFVGFINGGEDFFTLTEVQLPHQRRPLPFLALQRMAAILVLPEKREVAPASDDTVGHQVSCLLEGGVLMGALRLPGSQRVSDRLMNPDARYFVLRACTIGLDAPGGSASVESVAVVLVNSARVIGVSEM